MGDDKEQQDDGADELTVGEETPWRVGALAMRATLEELEDTAGMRMVMESYPPNRRNATRRAHAVATTIASFVANMGGGEMSDLVAQAHAVVTAEMALRPERYPNLLRFIRRRPGE